MIASNNTTRLPPHPYSGHLDWQINTNRKVAPHGGATDSFTYVFPVPKYSEAHRSNAGGSGGNNYISYLNYNHGGQLYDYKDAGFNATRTPKVPNWYALSKVSPKSSMPGIQLAQTQVSQLLMNRGMPYMGGGS